MKIKQFNLVDGVLVYPDYGLVTAKQPDQIVRDADGVEIDRRKRPDQFVSSNWGRTIVIGDLVIGEYFGSDDTIEDYTGAWPPVEYLTTFNSKQLLNAFLNTFNSDQGIAALMIPAVKAQLELLRLRTVVMTFDQANYQAAIAGLKAAGVLSESDYDEYKNGIPGYRLAGS